MKYTKPDVVLLASALEAVQSQEKTGISVDSINPSHPPMNPAYEADE